jgi:hypothetical protein
MSSIKSNKYQQGEGYERGCHHESDKDHRDWTVHERADELRESGEKAKSTGESTQRAKLTRAYAELRGTALPDSLRLPTGSTCTLPGHHHLLLSDMKPDTPPDEVSVWHIAPQSAYADFRQGVPHIKVSTCTHRMPAGTKLPMGLVVST